VYVGGNISRRIGSLQHSMQLLSDADFKLEISHSFQDDEIASIANELQAFSREHDRGRTIFADQDKDRVAKAERDPRMESRIADIEATVRAPPDNPQSSANSMQTTAHSDDGGSVECAGQCGGCRRGNLHLTCRPCRRTPRRIVLTDCRNQPPGGHGKSPAKPGRRDRIHLGRVLTDKASRIKAWWSISRRRSPLKNQPAGSGFALRAAE
jgi:hypothetical protein